MSPDRDRRRDDEGQSFEEYDGDAPRSIFSALWFRALVAVLVLGVIAAVAVPYILDFASHQSPKPTATKTRAAPATSASPVASATPPASPAPAAPPPAETPSAADTTTPPPPPAAATPPSPAPATKAAPAAKAASGAKSPAGAKGKHTVVAKADTTKGDTTKGDTAKGETAKEGKAASGTKSNSGAAAASPGGSYWVQVGAFRDAEAAKRVIGRLREQGFSAEQSTTSVKGSGPAAAPPPSLPPQPQGDRYHVIVSGASNSDVDSRLAAKGMTSEATPNGLMVQPSLPLREAVALSRDLADAGMTVQVRRVGGGTQAAAAPPPAADTSPAAKETLYRVRVGRFTDRAGAMAVMKHLEEKGYKPFIARGNE